MSINAAVQSQRGHQHPLDGTARALTEFDRRTACRFGAPTGPNWFSLHEASSRSVIAHWLTEMPASGQGLRNVAAARLGAGLACAVVRPLMGALQLHGRVPVLDAEHTWLRRSGSTFTGMALHSEQVFALESDPEADDPRIVTCSGIEQLLQREAQMLEFLFRPVVAAIRAEGRYGQDKLWGAVLDMV
ncbi:MAG: hypothetical protein ACRDRL_23310, partial [Sciscionella sp.]